MKTILFKLRPKYDLKITNLHFVSNSNWNQMPRQNSRQLALRKPETVIIIN